MEEPKIQQGNYTYDGIAVFGNGKLNETISADMTYNQIAEQIGEFDCRGVAQGTLVYSTEINSSRVSFFFTSYDNPDLSARIKNNMALSADMKTVNPKLKSIAIYKEKKNSSETGFSTNSGWKKAYRDYISEHYTSSNRFALIYVDNDDVPELKVSQELYVYSGNEVKGIRVGNGFAYKERSGEYAVSSLHQGYGGFTVYQLNNGDPTKIIGGTVNYNKDEYTINGESVDADTYNRIGDEWFDKYDSQYQTMTKDEVFKLLSE